MTLPDDDSLLLLHNPRCSKSRATKALLEERGATFSVREYLDEPLDRAELEDLGRRLGREPREFVRSKEAAFAEAGLGADSDAGALLDAMASAPILMERPVAIRGERAVIGRPPEDVLSLLDA